MLTTRSNRLDPSLIPDDQLTRLASLFAGSTPLTLCDEEGNQTAIPKTLCDHFARIVRLMSEHKAIVMLPEDEAFTTQAAANYLGMSRQHLVNLLDGNEIPHHKVGTHRRITFKDILAYERARDRKRREALDSLADEVIGADLYFPQKSSDDQE